MAMIMKKNNGKFVKSEFQILKQNRQQFGAQKSRLIVNIEEIGDHKQTREFLNNANTLQQNVSIGQSILYKYFKNSKLHFPSSMTQPNLGHNHFPEELQARKPCKNCHIMGHPTIPNSMYKCIECSAKYNTEVPLCLQCFAHFHKTVLPVCGFGTPNKMKTIYQQYMQQQNESEKGSNLEILSKQQPNHQKIKATDTNASERILAIDQTINDMRRLFDKFSRSQDAIPISKAFNQYLFLTNLKLLQKCQNQRSSSIIPEDQPNAHQNNEQTQKNKSEKNNIRGSEQEKPKRKDF